MTVGQTRWEKIKELRKRVSEKNATAHIIAALDDIVGLWNGRRGSDVKCNACNDDLIFVYNRK